MGGVPENEWIQRTRLLREAVAVAMLELERASDVRANRTKLIGKAHIILQAGMAASQ